MTNKVICAPSEGGLKTWQNCTPSEGGTGNSFGRSGKMCGSATPSEGVRGDERCRTTSQRLYRQRDDFTPSKGVEKTCGSATPSEGVRGDERCRTTSQRLYRQRDDFTPSKGVEKTCGSAGYFFRRSEENARISYSFRMGIRCRISWKVRIVRSSNPL